MQIEWHVNGVDLETDVLVPYNVHASYVDHKTGDKDEIEIQSDIVQLAQWVAKLGQGHQDSPGDGLSLPCR